MPKYAPRTSTAAIAKAKEWVGKSYPAGWCQKWVVAEIFGTGGVGDFDGDRAADAEDGWKAAAARGRVVKASEIGSYDDIPAGVALYWAGGSRDNGHAAVSAGDGYTYSTDLPTSGRVGRVKISEIARRWGMLFLGYVTVTGNGYTLTDKPSGPVDKMNPANYGPGAYGDHVTWLGQRLVVHGFGLKYTPGPEWTDADRRKVAAFQRSKPELAGDADGLPGRLTLSMLAAEPKPKPPAGKLPAQLIDLRRAKLTTPFGKEDRPTEIEQPGLNRYADSRCFFVRGDAVVFRVKGDGVTTSGSSYPRCELREMELDGDRADWDTRRDVHLLEALYQVSGNAKVVIAQIHDADDDLVMVSWQAGRIVVEWSKGKGKGSTKKQVGTVTAGAWFKVAIKAEGGKVTVELNDREVASKDVARAGCYQKAGAYLQDDDSDAWAEVAIAKDSLTMGEAA